MQNTENIQTSVLFDSSISYIETSSNDKNTIHKNCASTITHNNTITEHSKKYQAKSQSHNG